MIGAGRFASRARGVGRAGKTPMRDGVAQQRLARALEHALGLFDLARIHLRLQRHEEAPEEERDQEKRDGDLDDREARDATCGHREYALAGLAGAGWRDRKWTGRRKVAGKNETAHERRCRYPGHKVVE